MDHVIYRDYRVNRRFFIHCSLACRVSVGVAGRFTCEHRHVGVVFRTAVMEYSRRTVISLEGGHKRTNRCLLRMSVCTGLTGILLLLLQFPVLGSSSILPQLVKQNAF